MAGPVLDRDRMVARLRAAAEVADRASLCGGYRQTWELAGMARAWRVVAAGIEDGEYDADGAAAEVPATDAEVEQLRRLEWAVRAACRRGLVDPLIEDCLQTLTVVRHVSTP